ncbi:MAG: hypothetical protein OXL96_11445 [Candidatus Poribacteria bacterium]|nr:hypothetical protein [Candidatus Poribacteria bacterium]
MLVSAVVDPSAFDAAYFNELYTIQTVDFLKGIQRNGLLIIDSENRLRDALVEQVKSLPIKPQQRLRFLIQELLLKKKSKRVIACFVSLNNTSSVPLLDLAYHLKVDTGADALVVGKENLETLKSDRRFNEGIVLLAEYRDSDFEKDREMYETRVGPIDTLPKSEVEDILIRSIRFAKWLRFYDAYIGTGNHISRFRKGIEYILSLWYEHGFFASQQGIGSVEIYTCSAERILESETDHAKINKLERNRDNYQRVIRNLIEPVKKKFPYWPVKFSIKDDPNYIFHARFLEAEHAIIQMDRGFDLFKPNGGFQRNFFTLNMAGSPHLKQCRELPNANL